MPAIVEHLEAPCDQCSALISYLPSQRIGKHLYCCRECADLARRTSLEIECRWCGKPFIVTPTEYKNRRRLCSWACRVAEKEDARNRICEICGKGFRTRDAAQKTRTCGRECGSELRKRCKYIACEVCGKQVWVMPCHFEIRRFCSRECQAVGHSQEISGENHPNWRGGVSKLPYPFEWTEELRATIRERDGNACMECGTSQDLHVHHIDYDKTNCLPDNLITLCNSCNARANFGRRHWQNRYTNIVFAIYATQSRLLE